MVLILGAAPNTGNQGVSALSQSAVAGLQARGIGDISVADHGRGVRTEGETALVGLTHNRRLWRGDCLRTVALSTRFGGLGSASARAILNARAVLDVSGGDSFTDLYGPHRFRSMTLAKRVALNAGRPLILLPQTLGPFRGAVAKVEAARILSAAQAVFVRDRRSEALLMDLLGPRFDPTRHHRGPDMAVLLQPETPRLTGTLAAWLSPERDAPVAGLNVSGLLCNNATEARARYGLAANHPEQIEAAARAVLDSDPTMRLVLVSHVIRPTGDMESDHDAARALAAKLNAAYGARVLVAPQGLSASELKGLISRLDWFAGARMHATIAGFSTGVPTLGLGYSDKAQGVFEECGFGAHVADLRVHDARAVSEQVRASLACRAATAAELARGLPAVKARAEAQMDAIAAAIRACDAQTDQLAA